MGTPLWEVGQGHSDPPEPPPAPQVAWLPADSRTRVPACPAGLRILCLDLSAMLETRVSLVKALGHFAFFFFLTLLSV